MKVKEFKKVKAEAKEFILRGETAEAANLMERLEDLLSLGQYYEIADMVLRSLQTA